MIASKLLAEISSIELLRWQIVHYRARLNQEKENKNWAACAFLRSQLFGLKQVLQSKLN